MARHLLTPSLHDSWTWYQRLDSKEKQNFLDTLLKKRTTDPDSLEAMQRGIDFENYIRTVCATPGAASVAATVAKVDLNRLRCVVEIADMVRGGTWQEKVMFDVHYYGLDFLVYGRVDVFKRNWIYDIKSTRNYEVGKYTGAVQHPTYMVGLKMKNFRYLVSDGDDVYHEDYHLTPDMERQMFADYGELVDGILSDADFKRAYLENWTAFGDAKGVALNNPGLIMFAG